MFAIGTQRDTLMTTSDMRQAFTIARRNSETQPIWVQNTLTGAEVLFLFGSIAGDNLAPRHHTPDCWGHNAEECTNGHSNV